jgi:molecular chaperone GrpE
MGNPETPEEVAARQPGPVPPGTPPDEAPPDGGPASSGASPTGHPADSSDAPAASHPSPEEGPTGGEPVPAGTAASDGQGPEKPLRASERATLKRLEKERAEFLEQLQRTRADFDNFRKRMLRQQGEHVERAAEALVEKLLPVLDNFDAAIAHSTGFEQVQASLMAVLEKEGLERIHPLDKPFDPTEADAVAHEEGGDGPVVSEVLRSGYRWKGRVVRPAMVRVRG